MHLKEKSDDKIEGRGCTDGRKQREYITKEDATSPTVPFGLDEFESR